MPKLFEVKNQDGTHYAWAFECPGCGASHHTRGWQWNGSRDAPTLRPSILVTYNGPDAGVDGAPPAVCHSFVTDGKIQFLADCTHALAGQTVDLPDVSTSITSVKEVGS